MRKDRLSKVCRSKAEEYERYMEMCRDSLRTKSMYYTKNVEPGLAAYIIKHNAVTTLKNILYSATYPAKSRSKKNPYLVEETDFSGLLETDTHNLPFYAFWNLQNITRFTFVRDPYARLLSSYLDSLYISNPIQWRILGKAIRPSDPNHCVTNITFREYVEYYLQMVQNDECPESLILLNFQEANHCQVKYDYIGKFEQLENDTAFILKEVDMFRSFSFPHFKTDGDAAQITRLVKKIFEHFKDIKGCGMSLEAAIKRMWRRLQAKGILGVYDIPPLGLRNDNQHPVVQTTVMKAYLLGNLYGREKNRENALKEAYSQLPDTTIAELQHVFQLEMSLFGYDIYPDYIRSAKNYLKTAGRTFRFFEF